MNDPDAVASLCLEVVAKKFHVGSGAAREFHTPSCLEFKLFHDRSVFVLQFPTSMYSYASDGRGLASELLVLEFLQ